ncbi:acyltransferase [Escherichia coli]|nr:acyltransferase [Escherichia coli]EKG6687329.1 acyltransferase [Escherichia coli]KAB3183344.1 acyltransferase [Escherichia coli]KAB3187038.1 acyltransferase [Escherichia coli]KAB3198062.1 acyltransferase [Escherichia coli]
MKRLELTDYARFFAAMMVVLFHYTFNGIANGKISSIPMDNDIANITKYGYLGVELFFMISGYVIFYSAKMRTASQFAFSRVLRLFPSYWFAVIFTSVFIYFLGNEKITTDIKTTLINLTMLQSFLGAKDVDGVYWTLIFELKFYFVIFVFLLLGLQSKLDLLIKTWALMIFIINISNLGNYPLLSGYFSYFIAGALLSIARDTKSIITYTLLLMMFYCSITFSINHANIVNLKENIDYNTTVTGVLISLFFLFFLFQNTKYAQNLSLPLSTILGAIVYPLYLLHAHIGYMLLDKFANGSNRTLLTVIIIFFAITIAYLTHVIIEKKCSPTWKYLFGLFVAKPIEGIEKRLYKKTEES